MLLLGIIIGAVSLFLIFVLIEHISRFIKKRKKPIEMKYVNLFCDNIHLVKMSHEHISPTIYTLNLNGRVFEINHIKFIIDGKCILTIPIVLSNAIRQCKRKYRTEESERVATDILNTVIGKKKLLPQDTGQLSLSQFDKFNDHIGE